MGNKRKKRPVRPHCKVAPKDITPDKKKGAAPEYEVKIRISKRPKVDHYSGDIQASNTKALIEALAIIIQKAADVIGATPAEVYSVVATVLFADKDGTEEAEE